MREVEEALVNLQSTEARKQDAEVSTQGYAESLAATQSRYGQGLASLVELEDARRIGAGVPVGPAGSGPGAQPGLGGAVPRPGRRL